MWLELPVRLTRTIQPDKMGPLDLEGEAPIVQNLGIHAAMVNTNAISALIPNAPDMGETILFIGGAQYTVMEPYDKIKRMLVQPIMQSSLPDAA
jgi:hypothetical protein